MLDMGTAKRGGESEKHQSFHFVGKGPSEKKRSKWGTKKKSGESIDRDKVAIPEPSYRVLPDQLEIDEICAKNQSCTARRGGQPKTCIHDSKFALLDWPSPAFFFLFFFF